MLTHWNTQNTNNRVNKHDHIPRKSLAASSPSCLCLIGFITPHFHSGAQLQLQMMPLHLDAWPNSGCSASPHSSLLRHPGALQLYPPAVSPSHSATKYHASISKQLYDMTSHQSIELIYFRELTDKTSVSLILSSSRVRPVFIDAADWAAAATPVGLMIVLPVALTSAAWIAAASLWSTGLLPAVCAVASSASPIVIAASLAVTVGFICDTGVGSTYCPRT